MAKSPVKEAAGNAEEFLEDAVQALKKAARHVGDDAHDALGKAVSELAKAAESLVEEARTKGVPAVKGAAKDVVKTAKDHPVATTAVVAAAVALAGLALSRRNNND